MNGYTVTDNFLEVSAKFHEAAHVFAAEVPVVTRTAAKELADKAQANARSFSKTIHVDTREVTPNNVDVVAVSPGTPLAYLEEFGKDGSGAWQHPVYGHNNEVTQQSHPYLRPALEEIGPAIPRESLEEIAVGLREIGFEVWVD